MTDKKITMQPASEDIWDKKYRLKDKQGVPIDTDIDATYQRVARALADLEATDDLREIWYEKFLKALRAGAIPAGRITSNAGANEHKPETSPINCVVSNTINDSMDDIMLKVHEAALTLKKGSGIGYCFSTLRPRNAFVAGAGANTSGPLSFMDIYDKMCFTVASAGGRRGAQMATFDVGHPDVVEFIQAKRENGRLRQFNMSLLITEGFIDAVKNDKMWELTFPIQQKEVTTDLNTDPNIVWKEWETHEDLVVREDGLVAHRVYKTIKARRLWDMIMAATYDYAEPGFILIDKVNQMNNNWWCENIRATNPCVTGDTRLATQYGLVPIRELYEKQLPLNVTVDNRALEIDSLGVSVRAAIPAFMTSPKEKVFKVKTKAGYEIKATEWHDFYTQRGKIKLKDLKIGDELFIQSGQGQFGEEGSEDLGLVMGMIAGDGYLTNKGKGVPSAVINLWGKDRDLAFDFADRINRLISNMKAGNGKKVFISPVEIEPRNMVSLCSRLLGRKLAEYNFTAATKLRVPEVIWRGKEECVKGYLRALFQADGTVQRDDIRSYCSIRLASSTPLFLEDIQMLLSNFGIFGRIHKRRAAGQRSLPDGKGGNRIYNCQADYELIIGSGSRDKFMEEIGFLTESKNKKYHEWKSLVPNAFNEKFSTPIISIEYIGKEAVFDTTQNDKNNLIFNGIVTGNCGEQPLPPSSACLLGSINLTSFVKKPFTKDAVFDWKSYKETIAVFTRMLDNVVDINALPLATQRAEIIAKRRHGMGFLGLGSALAMLRIPYGSEKSIDFTEEATKVLAVEGWRQALELSKEKGQAPLLAKEYTVTKEMLRLRPEMAKDGYSIGDRVKGSVLHAKYSRYMQQIAEVEPQLVEDLATYGARFTHHSSIAPTGTISLSLANNASNGIEPSFAHHYSRNVIREGKKSKEKVDVFSFELLAYRTLINPDAMPFSVEEDTKLPDYFISSDQVTPKQHIDIQAASQKWIDSSISKTANVPTDFPFEDFKDIYLYAYEKGLKGCTTFRFNPEVFQGVLVNETDLANTTYKFTLEDGSTIELKGNDDVEYDGETHSAANLYDALKEGYYGKF